MARIAPYLQVAPLALVLLVFLVIPVVMIVLALQLFLIAGLTAGAVKS